MLSEEMVPYETQEKKKKKKKALKELAVSLEGKSGVV